MGAVETGGVCGLLFFFVRGSLVCRALRVCLRTLAGSVGQSACVRVCVLLVFPAADEVLASQSIQLQSYPPLSN